MSDSPSAYSYIALVARLESLAEALATSSAVRRRLPQVQDPNDVEQDQAESSLQGAAADTSDEQSEKSWNEIAVLLRRIADGLREQENRRPLVSTSLPSLLNTFTRLTLQLSPLASSSTASAVITNHSQIEDIELPSVEKLAVAESAAAESNIQAGKVEWLEEIEELDMRQVYASLRKHEEVIKEIGRVAANLAIDDDSNRDIINLYLYPIAVTQLLFVYSTDLQSAPLNKSIIGTLKALIGSTLNLVLGDVSAIQAHFLQPVVMDTLISLYEVLRSSETNTEVDSTDVETLCEWLWKVIEAATTDEKISAIPTPGLLSALQASFQPFSESLISKPSSKSLFSPSTTLSILNIICSTTGRAFSDNSTQFTALFDADSKLLRRLVSFAEHGIPPAVWLEVEDDDDIDEEEDDITPVDASESLQKPTRQRQWEKQLGLAKASILRLIIEACGELDMSQESASWFWSEMERWLESYGRTRMDGAVDEGRPDLIACALLCFGNLARTEHTATSLLLPTRPKPLLPVLRPLLRGSTSVQVQHALIGLLKNLAISPANKPILGKAGVIEGMCDMGVWLEKRDIVGSVQGGAVGLVKHLCYGNAANSLKIANHLSLQTIDGPLHQLIALHSRTDDTALKCETSRVFVNVIRSLWLYSTTESPPLEEKVVTEAKKIMINSDVVHAIVGLLAAGKDAGHAVLVNEGVVASALLCKDEAGLELVSKIYLETSSDSTTTYPSLASLLSLLHPPATKPSNPLNPLNPMSSTRSFILSPEVKSNIVHLLRVLVITWKKDDQTSGALELVKNRLVGVDGPGETGAAIWDIQRLLE